MVTQARVGQRLVQVLSAGVIAVVLVATGAEGVPRGCEAHWQAPVAGTVVDGFRPPAHIGAPGNRGWEYQTVPGSRVVAAGAGRIVFAGAIAGRLYVSIDHPCGLRTTYSGLASVEVVRGEQIEAGTGVGTAADRFHFGVRQGAAYLDPASLFRSDAAAGVRRPRLVPLTLGPR